ncbi:MAG: dimethylargininase [Marmoricola sp.]
MTSSVVSRVASPVRRARPRRFLMCPPTFFDVTYAINPWMHPDRRTDTARAVRQWTALVESYRAFGHRVDLLEPVEGLADMVFTANGATVVDGLVLGARFAAHQRTAEAAAHVDWHRRFGASYGGRVVRDAVAVNEAEGDFVVLSDRVLAGYGFRTAPSAHRELAALTGREVIGLELVDPRFYHLDVALAVLDDVTDHLAYYPEAFSDRSRRLLERLFPDALIATSADAFAFGLNLVSDGLNVFVPTEAGHLVDALRSSGYRPVRVELDELVKGGGSVKCCTQEIRPPDVPRTIPTNGPTTELPQEAP